MKTSKWYWFKWYWRWMARRRAANQALTTAAAAEWLRSYQEADEWHARQRASSQAIADAREWYAAVASASGGLNSAERDDLARRTGLEPLAYTVNSYHEGDQLGSPDYVSPAVIAASRAYADSAGLLGEEDWPASPPSDPTVFGPG